VFLIILVVLSRSYWIVDTIAPGCGVQITPIPVSSVVTGYLFHFADERPQQLRDHRNKQFYQAWLKIQFTPWISTPEFTMAICTQNTARNITKVSYWIGIENLAT